MQVVVSGSRGRWCNVEPRRSTPIGLVVKKRLSFVDIKTEDQRIEVLSKQTSSSLSRVEREMRSKLQAKFCLTADNSHVIARTGRRRLK
jgi:hypothetical protein